MVIKVDQAFGTIGFQQIWLNLQGYRNRNLADLIFNRCNQIGLDVLFLTSEEKRIPKGSVHDRFDYIIHEVKISKNNYKFDILENVGLILEKNNNRLIIINSQVCIAFYNNRRIDHMIVGSNQIQKDGEINLEEAIKKAEEEGLIQILSHPASTSFPRWGGGKEILEEFGLHYDAIVAHDTLVSKKDNQRALEMSEHYKIPGLAFSDAHCIKEISYSHSTLDCEPDLSNSQNLIHSLKEGIKKVNSLDCERKYSPLLSKVKQGITFVGGIALSKLNPQLFEQEEGYKIESPKEN